MRQKTAAWLGRFIPILFAGLSWGFCVLFYISILLKEQTFQVALGTAAVLCFACACLPKAFVRVLDWLGGAGLAIAAAIFLMVTMGGGRYEPVQGSYSQSVYGAAEKVMVIVPHEDDDLNLAAGVIDSYRAEDTQVRVVFFSNGDYRFKNAYRLNESLNSQYALGVPEEDVIFLGYGDQYDSVYGHLYNAPPQETVTSCAGYTRTYGLPGHLDYSSETFGSASSYTRTNAVRDMQELLLAEQPDVIYCIDQDSHPDHRATGLIFEEALGNILASGEDYHPSVYKGFGYSTAWNGKADYSALNVPSTVRPYESGRMEEANCYIWDERLRLPVMAEDLAYTRQASALWPAFTAYGSQRALDKMDRMVNGDKVYWHRRTDSLLYKADFSATGGSKLSLLQDFKLADSDNVTEAGHRPFDGTWVPETEEILTVRLKEPAEVREICLYDNPSLEDNILQARITLDNGDILLTGALEPGGSATHINLQLPDELSSFTVEILEKKGEKAGLSEVEAYDLPAERPGFIKLTDEQENFLYTYTPEDDSTIRLKVYASKPEWSVLEENPGENFTATAEGIPLDCDEEAFLLPCPEKKTTVRVQMKEEPSVYDEIIVKPYSVIRTALFPRLQFLDDMVCAFYNQTEFHTAKIYNTMLKALGRL